MSKTNKITQCEVCGNNSLKEVLESTEIIGEVKLLKVACSFPLVDSKIETFCRGLDHLIIVEEKRGFLEGEVRAVISGMKNFDDLKIHGKSFFRCNTASTRLFFFKAICICIDAQRSSQV